MNCIIPSGNIKIVNKALHTLAKIGDELYIEAKPDYLQFATINQSKTSYVTIDFQNVFFSAYEIGNPPTTSGTSNVTCKLYIKAILNLFKTKGPKERNIDWCKIELERDPTKLLLKIKYKQDIVVNHWLNLIDMEFISVPYDCDKMLNRVSSTGIFFAQVLNNFQASDEDMSLEVKSNKILVRNYDVASNNTGKKIRSQVVLNSTEFTSYRIGLECNVTMSFKPFRAAVAFAEGFLLPVVMNFDTGGKPVILTIKNPIFETNLVLSTISPDGFTQSCTGTTTVLSKSKKGAELSKEDRTMLETLDWDSDFEMDGEDVMMRDPEEVVESEKNGGRNRGELGQDEVIPESPESPRTKRLKVVFGRCFETTYRESNVNFGEELAPNSDSE